MLKYNGRSTTFNFPPTARAWAAPQTMLASLYLTAAQYDAAWRAAHEAYLRTPDSAAVQVAFASVWSSCFDGGRTDWDALLQFVNDIQTKVPFEEQSFLIKLSLLAIRTGVEPAAEGVTPRARQPDGFQRVSVVADGGNQRAI